MEEEACDNINQLTDLMKEVEEQIDLLVKHESFDKLTDDISYKNTAQLSNSLAYLMNTLYYCYLKTNGISLENHKVITQIEQVKKYFSKLDSALEEENKKKIIVDTSTAQRIILNTIERAPSGINIQEPNPATIQSMASGSNQSSRILHKGAIMPVQKHLNWKDEINKIMKQSVQSI